MGVNIAALISFIAYLSLVISIGILTTRFSSTGISEYFIAGRKMNRFVVALSAVVSGRSAWAGLGAALGPTSILALYWKRTTRSGVIAGLITGTLTTIIWYYIAVLKGIIYELIPAFFLGFLVTYLVSKLTTPPKEIDDFFTSMKE